MKDVPTQLPEDLQQAAVLQRGPVFDLLVYKRDIDFLRYRDSVAHIATSSIRRIAQWLNRYPHHHIHNLRGNVNTRLRKLAEEDWDGAIFAQAGLERIHLRPEKSTILDWMLPAPAQGAIMVVSRAGDEEVLQASEHLNDPETALCTKIERDFLRTLLGGCSTPISALAEIEDGELFFRGQLLSLDGRQKMEIEKILPQDKADGIGRTAALELLEEGGKAIVENIRAAEEQAATARAEVK
jgi:hydroxymethylbilane synthase